MKKTTIRSLALIALTLSIFTIGVLLEPDYRFLTRKTILYFSRFKIDYYGGKEFWIFPTDVAFISTLIPIGFFLFFRKLSTVTLLQFALLHCISMMATYCFFCYLESEYIRLTVTNPMYKNGFLLYHSNAIHYNEILLLTILTSFGIDLLFKKLLQKSTP
ncbi:hypothetical protein [Flavobacterium sp. GCM10027622]|uniref:hypothetical protein n=1 Tax=unclassified Flavobacterium TaxID=196869 RepID=UPI003612866B